MSNLTGSLALLADTTAQRQARQDRLNYDTAHPDTSAQKAMGGFLGNMMREDAGKRAARDWLAKNGGDPSVVDLPGPMGLEATKGEIARTFKNLETRRAASMLGYDTTNPTPGADSGLAFSSMPFGGQAPPAAPPNFSTSLPGTTPGNTPPAPPPNISMPGDFGLNAPPPTGARPQGMMGDVPMGPTPRAQGSMEGAGFGGAPAVPPVASAPPQFPSTAAPDHRRFMSDLMGRFASGAGGYDAGALEAAKGFAPPEVKPLTPLDQAEIGERNARAEASRTNARSFDQEKELAGIPRPGAQTRETPEEAATRAAAIEAARLDAQKKAGAGDFKPKATKDVKGYAAAIGVPYFEGMDFADADRRAAAEGRIREGALTDQQKARATFVRGEIGRLATARQRAELLSDPTVDIDKQLVEFRAEYDRIAPPIAAPVTEGSGLGDVTPKTTTPPRNGPDPNVAPQAAAAANAATVTDENAGATPEELALIQGNPEYAADWVSSTKEQRAAKLKQMRGQ